MFDECVYNFICFLIVFIIKFLILVIFNLYFLIIKKMNKKKKLFFKMCINYEILYWCIL